VVMAGRYDESLWRDGAVADGRPLERFHADALALLSRVDGHSCIVNAKTLAGLALAPETPGIERDAAGDPTGKLFLDANWRAQALFAALLPVEARRRAERDAVEAALSRGALHLHAQLLGHARDAYAEEIAALQRLPAKIHPKICEPDAALAAELGLPYVGGDVFLDGSIGSRTAALFDPYSDGGGCGTLRFDDDALLAFYAQAESLGVSAGVHAIGDAAIEQSLRVWERVLGGNPSPRGCRHFIEHFELATSDQIAACARMGIYVSMQPCFDARWAGERGMYDARLGTKRRRSMNALATIAAANATLCGGSDSPVCALDPLAGMQACLDHHEPSQRLEPAAALAAFTIDAARFGHAERQTGNLLPGLAADFVVLDRDPLEAGQFAGVDVLATWSDGTPVWANGSLL
ncbi:MAG TPA: amidohydrolase family protein, partial [Candidatus Tumulicola sp.]|nr:amidohydrolase family protein [Candidatus Tumulicola sp.]